MTVRSFEQAYLNQKVANLPLRETPSPHGTEVTVSDIAGKEV
jgi:hypothetical protein